MTLQQLEYVLTIAQEGSITKAAQRLFKAQPNISNALKDLEEELNIKLFERVPRGVVLSIEGEAFLTQASALLDQANRLQAKYTKEAPQEILFRISIARSSYMMQGISKWINESIHKDAHLQVHMVETNTNQVIDDIRNARSDLGIIRIPSDQQPYFNSLLENKHIVQKTLAEFPLRLVFKKNHPLQQRKQIKYEDLKPYTEIIHGDDRITAVQRAQINTEIDLSLKARRVYVYDRGSQINLLEMIDDAYMWVSPIPLDMLEHYQMVLRDVDFATVKNKDLIIYRKDSLQLPFIQACSDYVYEYASALQISVDQRLEK